MIHTLRPIGQVFLAESRLIGTQILQFALRPAYLRQVVNNPRPLWIVGIWFLVAQVISMTLKFGFALMGIAGSSLVVAGIPKLLVVVAVLALIGRENFILFVHRSVDGIDTGCDHHGGCSHRYSSLSSHMDNTSRPHRRLRSGSFTPPAFAWTSCSRLRCADSWNCCAVACSTSCRTLWALISATAPPELRRSS